MSEASYIQRREELQHYFDCTANDAWKKLTSQEQLNGIRATVRAGRDRMRATLLSYLPNNLSGWRVLDAGCGTGALSAALALRGAHVVGIDLSPALIEHAKQDMPEPLAGGSITLEVGDMLQPPGQFDAIVAMDSLIHYRTDDVLAALGTLARHADRAVLFTFAPFTSALAVMHTLGRAFPRSNRAPSIVPIRPQHLTETLSSSAELNGFAPGRTQRIKSGFYTSQAMELLPQ
ncbi:MAG: magnesium protoporphyrin IX methyltransferase [Pseudomonadota bacterium]